MLGVVTGHLQYPYHSIPTLSHHRSFTKKYAVPVFTLLAMRLTPLARGAAESKIALSTLHGTIDVK